MADFFEQLGKKISDVVIWTLEKRNQLKKERKKQHSARRRYEKFRRYSRCY